MSTTTEQAPSAPTQPEPFRTRWIDVAWGVSLRLALRDMRRHLLRSMAVVLLIAAPMALVGALLTLMNAESPSDRWIAKSFEHVPGMVPAPGAVNYLPPALSEEPQAIRTYGALVRELKSATSIDFLPFLLDKARVQDRQYQLAQLSPGMAEQLGMTLTEGRWPVSADEIVVHQTVRGDARLRHSRAAIQKPSDRSNDGFAPAQSVRIVGVASSTLLPGNTPEQPDIITVLPDDIDSLWNTRLMMSPDTSDTAVRHFNSTTNPRFVTPALAPRFNSSAYENATLYAKRDLINTYAQSLPGVLVVMLLIGVTILPVYAMTCQALQQQLNLLAIQGASIHTLRAVVTWQAALLGVVGSLVGACFAELGVFALRRGFFGNIWPSSAKFVEVQWFWYIAGTCLVLAVSWVAAWRASGRITDLGLAAATPRYRPGHLHIALLGVSAACVAAVLLNVFGSFGVMTRVLAVALAAACAAPALLQFLHRMSDRTMPWMRLGMRDAARHPARSSALIAATSVLVILWLVSHALLLTAIRPVAGRSVPSGSDTLARNTAILEIPGWRSDQARVRQAKVDAQQAVPRAQVADVSLVASGDVSNGEVKRSGARPYQRLAVKGSLCEWPSVGTSTCDPYMAVIASAETLKQTFGHNPVAREALEQGRPIHATVDGVTRSRPTHIGLIGLEDSKTGDEMPAKVVGHLNLRPLDPVRIAFSLPGYNHELVILTDNAARELGITLPQSGVLVHNPNGDLTSDQILSLEASAARVMANKPPQRPHPITQLMPLVHVMAAVFLILVTALSTGLAQLLQQPTTRTMLAVGAPRSFGRGMMAMQSGVLVLSGVIIGLVTTSLLGGSRVSPHVWFTYFEPLQGAVLVALPFIAAGVAYVMTKTPPLQRRGQARNVAG